MSNGSMSYGVNKIGPQLFRMDTYGRMLAQRWSASPYRLRQGTQRRSASPYRLRRGNIKHYSGLVL